MACLCNPSRAALAVVLFCLRAASGILHENGGKREADTAIEVGASYGRLVRAEGVRAPPVIIAATGAPPPVAVTVPGPPSRVSPVVVAEPVTPQSHDGRDTPVVIVGDTAPEHHHLGPGTIHAVGYLDPHPSALPPEDVYVDTDRLNGETESVIAEEEEEKHELAGDYYHEHDVSRDVHVSTDHTTPQPGGFCNHRRRNYDGCKQWSTTADGVPEEMIGGVIQPSDSRRRCLTSIDCEVDNVDGEPMWSPRRRCLGECR